METVDIKNDVRYVPNHLIDKQKWDACILSSDQPLIYATSVYLDGMCKCWDAMVMGDYQTVMPLPWNKKWLVSYIYSPYFVVAGGVFGKEVSGAAIEKFISAIPHRFAYIDFDLNEGCFFPELLSQNCIRYRERRNMFLNLYRTYEEIFSAYSTLAKRKVKKAATQYFLTDRSLQVKQVIELYKQHYRQKDSVIAKFDFTRMISLLEGQLSQQTRTYILSFPDGEISAFYLLLFDDDYVYWLVGGSTERGKESGAFYYLTDLVIKDFSNTRRLFRFEGSDHDGIHFFNQQFGGQTVFYPHININRLPWPFRYLKNQ